eukprot:365046-Chlamydomonas_euryale.AAC.5
MHGGNFGGVSMCVRARPHACLHAWPRAQPHAWPRAQPHAWPRAQPHAWPRAQPHAWPRAQPHAWLHASMCMAVCTSEASLDDAHDLCWMPRLSACMRRGCTPGGIAGCMLDA